MASVLLMIAVLVVGYIAYSNNQAKKAKQVYSSNVDVIMLQMISCGESAEELLNLTGQVWYNTIYEKSDSATDKFTKNSKGFESDFNTSLTNLSSDKNIVEKIVKIKSGQSEVNDTMKKLQSPSESFKKVYDTLLELYISYQGFTELAINPKGNLTSFNNSKSEKIDKFLELYKILQTLMPNKK